MSNNSTKSTSLQTEAETAIDLLDDWFDPIEVGLRDRVREFIQAMIEAELEAALSPARYARRRKEACENADGASGITGHRHGHRSRSLLGTFGRVEIAVPRARLATAEGKTTEWKSAALRAYQRRTKQADSLIAGAYLAGINTRRVRRALSAVFGGAVSKDTVSRVWRKVKGDWDAWNARSLAEDPIIRVILDGAAVRVRLDRKATSIVLLVVLGVREDGQKMLLAVKNMGGETSQASRAVLDDLKRGLRQPEFLIVDGGSGLEQALAALWGDVPTQRCTVHKHRNLLAHAPQRLHEEVSADYNDMIYAASAAEIAARRRAFIRKWRLKCKAVADSLEEAGDRLFTFTRLPADQWKSARTTNAIERLHEEFKRRIKTQTVLPSAETAAMLFWALLAAGQITVRKVDGWQTLNQKLADRPIDLAA
jgi:putative transposase